MKAQKKNLEYLVRDHGHEYICENMLNGIITACDKLPPILKELREETNYTFKIPHGNKVRTLILEEGICNIVNGNTVLYSITIRRW